MLHTVHKDTDNRTKTHRQHDLNQRLYHHTKDIDRAAFQCAGNAKGNGKQQKSHCIVNGNHQKQQSGQRAVSLILANHHQRGCRGSCGSDGSQNKCGRQRDNLREQ